MGIVTVLVMFTDAYGFTSKSQQGLVFVIGKTAWYVFPQNYNSNPKRLGRIPNVGIVRHNDIIHVYYAIENFNSLENLNLALRVHTDIMCTLNAL